MVGQAAPGQAAPGQAATFGFSTQCSAADYNGDPRLGPADLPNFGSVGFELLTYDRFGGLTPEQFISKWWDPTAQGGSGGWRYPPANGFLIGPNDQPIHGPVTVRAGQEVDRYGSEFGAFLAPAGELYGQRAVPPQSLDNQANPGGCNYNAYLALRAFAVDGGPIAPAFEQIGLGVQYRIDATLVPGAPAQINVKWLVDNGYLRRCPVVPLRPFTC